MGSFFYGLSVIFPRLMDHMVEISILICLIFLVKQLVPKKLPQWWHYSLWLLLLARMLVPVEFENQLNVFNFLPAVEPPHVSEFIKSSPPEDLIVPQPITPEVSSADPHIQFVVKKSIPVIWFSGAMILGICILFESVSFWMSVRRKPILNDKEILALFSQCKNRMGVKRKIDIVVTDSVRCPALFGYLRPRLLLPEGIFNKIGEKELSYAFMHELGHLKRHDIGVSWLIAVLQVVHWCNPLVWLAFYQIRVDQEAACDAAVLSRMKPKQSADYAKAIVGFLEKFCQNCQLPALAGVLENRTQMKKRIAKIVQYRKSSQKLSAIAFALFATAGCILFTLTGVAEEKDSLSFTEPVAVKPMAESPPAPAKNSPFSTWSEPDGFREAAASVFPNAARESVADADDKHENSLISLSALSEAAPADEALSQPRMVSNIGEDYPGRKVMEREVRPISLAHLTADKPSTNAELEPVVTENGVASEKPVSKPAELVKPAPIEISRVADENTQTHALEVAAQMNRLNTQVPNEEVPVSTLTVNSADVLVAALDIEFSSAPNSKEDFGPAPSITVPQSDSDITTEENYSETERVGIDHFTVAAEIEMIKETGKALLQNKSAKATTTILAKREKKDDTGAFIAAEVDTPPQVIKAYPPRYPYLAKRDDISGSIMLQFVITKEGNAVGTKVLESEPKGIFDESALQAIEQYRFKPGIKDGKAVDVKVNLPIRFDLT